MIILKKYNHHLVFSIKQLNARTDKRIGVAYRKISITANHRYCSVTPNEDIVLHRLLVYTAGVNIANWNGGT